MGLDLAKILAKGGEFISNNKEAIQLGFEILNNRRSNRRSSNTLQTSENNLLTDGDDFERAFVGVVESVSELQNAFEESVEYFENRCNTISADLDTLKKEHEASVTNLQNQLTQFHNEYMNYKIQMRNRLISICITTYALLGFIFYIFW